MRGLARDWVAGLLLALIAPWVPLDHVAGLDDAVPHELGSRGRAERLLVPSPGSGVAAIRRLGHVRDDVAVTDHMGD